MTTEFERAAAKVDAFAESRHAAEFRAVDEGRYRMEASGCTLEIDYLRRESGQLKGELMVRCNLPGAQTYHGNVLAVGDINLSAPRTRQQHAKYLAERSRAKESDVDWTGMLEDFAQRVLTHEREGDPSVMMSEIPEPAPESYLQVLGIPLLDRLPMIVFGDGGTAKSYLALYIAAMLADAGKPVAYFDWEFDGGEHRKRLAAMFQDDMPPIHYVRCVRPLVYEIDRLRRIVREKEIEYAIFDSIAFACAGAPESAEVAAGYFQALRRLGTIGSLHVAHVTKATDGADRRPFGSTFWHNGARATWNVKPSEGDTDDDQLIIGLYNRKASTGPLHRSVGVRFKFAAECTTVHPINLTDVHDLASNQPVTERIRAALLRGPKLEHEIKDALGDDVNDSTYRSAIKRLRDRDVVLSFPGPDGVQRLSLAGREPHS